jgi:hypothetical protein
MAISAAACLYAADAITGLMRMESNITRTKAGTVTTVTETMINSYKWGGTGALGTGGQASAMSVLYAVNFSIIAGGTNTLDLYGSLLDNFGATVNLARVKWMQLSPSNSMVTPQTMLIRAAPANGFGTWMSATTAAVRAFSGGTFAIMAPATNAYAVTDSTGDLLEIVNESTNAATGLLYIGGE